MRWAAHAALGDDLGHCAARVIEDVRRDLAETAPDLVLAFAVPGFTDDLARQIAEAFPGAVVVGTASGGVIGGHRELEHQSSVAVAAGCFPGATVHVQAVGRELALKLEPRHLRASLAPDGASPALVLALLDPKVGEPEPLLASLDAAFPDAVISGGLASGAIRGPCLLVDGNVSAAGAVLVSVAGPVRAREVVAQGCRPIGQPMLVTQVEGQLVHALGQRKPMEVMQELHAGLDPADRALFERAVFLGVEMRDQVEYGPGDFLIRNVLGIEPRSGALAVDARLDPWKAVQFHLRDAAASREDLRACLDRAGADGFAPTAALLFSCLGRGEGLYGEPSHDTRAVRERFGDIPVGGFFCNGEIGRVGDRTYLHGYTSTLVLLEPSP